MAERTSAGASTPRAKVAVEPGKIRDTKWWEHLIRFAFGGLVTAAAGWIGEKFGPVVGGLFLAFPAILPASLSIMKQREGKEAAGLDAAGAIAGSVGLMVFALVIWRAGARIAPVYTLVLAAIGWLLASLVALVIGLRIHPPQDHSP